MLSALVSIACSSVPPASPRDVADANDTGRELAATSESERAVLRQVQSLPSGKAQRVGEVSVVAAAPYAAASGRTCRALHITPANQAAVDRLACTSGKAWFFVPDVFGSADVKAD